MADEDMEQREQSCHKKWPMKRESLTLLPLRELAKLWLKRNPRISKPAE